LRLAEVISTRLADAAWEDLHRWFWTARIEAIETAEASEIGIADLPNADDGHHDPFRGSLSRGHFLELYI